MNPRHSHTHCQATQTNALTQAWQRECLSNRKTEKLTDEEEHRTDNSTYPKGVVSCSKDSFVVNQTLVFQIKFCGKSPALRVAAIRYASN
jgi:hypothetical protein